MKLYISKNGSVIGPYTPSQINQQINAGIYQETDFACVEGSSEWLPLGSVGGINFQNKPKSKEDSPSCGGLLGCGYAFSIVGFFILPWVFSIVSFILGIVLMFKGKDGHGIAIMLLSILGIVGWFFLVAWA